MGKQQECGERGDARRVCRGGMQREERLFLCVTAPQISVSDVQAPITEQEVRQEVILPGPRMDFPDNAGRATTFPRAREGHHISAVSPAGGLGPKGERATRIF